MGCRRALEFFSILELATGMCEHEAACEEVKCPLLQFSELEISNAMFKLQLERFNNLMDMGIENVNEY